MNLPLRAQRLTPSSDRSTAGPPARRVRPRSRGGWAAAVALLLAALAAVGLWLASASGAPSADARVQSIGQGLRCPACAGESVAQSRSDMAQQMRGVIAQQVAAGRSDAQVRSWFAERYGDGILTDPPWHGPGLALQLAPLLVVAGGVLVLLAVRRPAWRAPLARSGTVVAAGLAVAAVVSTLR